MVQVSTLDLTCLAYLMEILHSLGIKLSQKKSPSIQVMRNCLKLKEKCILLVKQFTRQLKDENKTKKGSKLLTIC